MLSILIAATLLQASPGAVKLDAPQDNGMPKTDYELVAWCHGALAGQLELEPQAKAAMEKIEGKAKVAARAKEDAELLKERRQYLKDYEHALSSAESASPTPIHKKGVDAELRGYALWTATRNKEPIWLMVDWGMWDPNDIGCSTAAKRLYAKSALFGEALKGADESPARADDAAPESVVASPVEAADAVKADEAKADDFHTSALKPAKPRSDPETETPSAPTVTPPADVPPPPPGDTSPAPAPALRGPQ